MNEMAAVAEASPPMTLDGERRVAAMLATIQAPQDFDTVAGLARLGELLGRG